MKLLRLAMPVIALFALVGSAAADSVRYLMTIENVNTTPFNVQSFSWGMSNPVTIGSGGGMSTGRVSISSFNVMKTFDGASTIMANACATGTHFPSARVRAYRNTSTVPFMDLYFEEVMVESIQWSASQDSNPSESVSFAFARVTLNGVLLAQPVASNPAALNQLIAKMIATPAKPGKKASAISVR